MKNYLLKILIKLVLLWTFYSDIYAQIDITVPCRYPVAVGLEKEYIPDSNLWASSETDSDRGPKYARLNGYKGGGSWTAKIPNNEQYLGIDLGYRHAITGVATQGRRGSYEYVTEYYLEFSSDNETWSIYTNEFGTPLMFKGNTNDDTPYRNDLEYSIIARFLRFNPQRWNEFISMRVELYGCRFDGAAATFSGDNFISYDLSGDHQFVQTRKDNIKLRFRTNEQDGLLIFADSNQGDYIVLELLRGRLYFHLDLGSTSSQSGETTLKVGSLLDDNQWHDVHIQRAGRKVNLTVDRLTITNMTNGDFLQLDLDRHIFLGGMDNYLKPGKRMYSQKNFVGCMENVWFDYMNIIEDIRYKKPRYTLHGAMSRLGKCEMSNIVPITFPSMDSFLKVPVGSEPSISVRLEFRTFNHGGVLLSARLGKPNIGRLTLKINVQGHIEYALMTEDSYDLVNIILNYDRRAGYTKTIFTDGQWHSLDIDMRSGDLEGDGELKIVVDGTPSITTRKLQFKTAGDIFIGGGDEKELELGEDGFLGCIRNLVVNNEDKNFNIENGIIQGSCQIQDRCDPNPCEHGGICSQDFNSFHCDCDNTGYEGEACHKSAYYLSCDEVMRYINIFKKEVDAIIDIDGSGPLEPINVVCERSFSEGIRTVIHHQNEESTEVNGYSAAGSYIRPITYEATKEHFDEYIPRASTCKQFIKYECQNSRLLSDAGAEATTPSWGWWVGRTNLNMRYWGGSSPGSKKCACALQDSCITTNNEKNEFCNCDSGLETSDEGDLIHKQHLPVMELRFGDTGIVSTKEKWGRHTLGPLICVGDSYFNNTVTFRKSDATIEFDTFGDSTSGDVRFEFKTTVENGIFLQNTGEEHFIEVKLVFGNTIQFRFNVGNGIHTLEKTTSYPLNDDDWHTVHVERNRKEASLKVDTKSASLPEPTDQSFRKLELNSRFVIGAAVDYKDGFVGCMRAFMANGELMDLRGKVESGEVEYGVSAGCQPKCASNPCMNNGICIEWYSHYECDCAYTPFRGWDCGREVGVNMRPDTQVKYMFDHSAGKISTDEEDIIIGFSCQSKDGRPILMQIVGEKDGEEEYISIELNNNGGVRVLIDTGWKIDQQEMNSDFEQDAVLDLANSQQHVVHVKRVNKGRTMILQIDDYPPKTQNFGDGKLDESADTKIDNPKYIYFGSTGISVQMKKKGTSDSGFSGCLFRAQFDNIWPFKDLFQDPPNRNIVNTSGTIREDMCAFEEILNIPEKPEFRPTPAPDPDRINTTPIGGIEKLGSGDNTMLGGILAVVLLLMIGTAFLIGRFMTRHRGDYKTYEAKDHQFFDNPDFAIAAGASGQPESTGKKEYFL